MLNGFYASYTLCTNYYEKCAKIQAAYRTWFVIFTFLLKHIFPYIVFHRQSLDWAVFWWYIKGIFCVMWEVRRNSDGLWIVYSDWFVVICSWFDSWLFAVGLIRGYSQFVWIVVNLVVIHSSLFFHQIFGSFLSYSGSCIVNSRLYMYCNFGG